MPQADPARRQAVVEALARHRARRRIREAGGDWATVLAQYLAEAEADPQTDAIIALAGTAPPPEEWDPETRRAIRRALRQPGRKPSDGR